MNQPELVHYTPEDDNTPRCRTCGARLIPVYLQLVTGKQTLLGYGWDGKNYFCSKDHGYAFAVNHLDRLTHKARKRGNRR